MTLFRMLDLSAGQILIDGLDISQLPRHDIRSRINSITQDGVFIQGSVRDNIDPRNVHNVDAICDALEVVQLLELIEEKGSNGLSSDISELHLSQGQKQLFCLARALLNPSQILVLDEATSALDSRTEQAIQETLARIAESRTTIIIAHRLSTIVNADQIVVLDEGRVAERGTHDQLLEREGLYADLWYRQAAERLAEEVAEAAE